MHLINLTILFYMDWFQQLFHFKEKSSNELHKLLSIEEYSNIQKRLQLNDDKLIVFGDNNIKTTFNVGKFELSSLKELQIECNNHQDLEYRSDILYEHIIISNIFEEHSKQDNQYSTFQAASQYNGLEFPSPHILPEMGITNYENDRTQGPNCALACAAGTLVRNYLVEYNRYKGQTKDNQINYLDDLLSELSKNVINEYQIDNISFKGGFFVKNGYTFVTKESLNDLNIFLNTLTIEEIEQYMSYIKIGIHKDVGVTFINRDNTYWVQANHSNPPIVTQVYASAPSIAYNTIKLDTYEWNNLSQLLLNAQYESTIRVAFLNKIKHNKEFNSNKVYLTFLGGGVYGNERDCILKAIARAINIAKKEKLGLQIYVCYYKKIDLTWKSLLDDYIINMT